MFSGLKSSPTNNRWSLAHFHPALSFSRCEYNAAAPPATTAPAAPANMAYLPQDCHLGVAAASSVEDDTGAGRAPIALELDEAADVTFGSDLVPQLNIEAISL